MVFLVAKQFANGTKDVHFYSSDFMHDGIDLFQLEYNIEYDNGEFKHGDCSLDTDKVLNSFGFTEFQSFKDYLVNKYNNDDDAWKKIVAEMEAKGLKPMPDESVGGTDFMTNIF